MPATTSLEEAIPAESRDGQCRSKGSRTPPKDRPGHRSRWLGSSEAHAHGECGSPSPHSCTNSHLSRRRHASSSPQSRGDERITDRADGREFFSSLLGSRCEGLEQIPPPQPRAFRPKAYQKGR